MKKVFFFMTLLFCLAVLSSCKEQSKTEDAPQVETTAPATTPAPAADPNAATNPTADPNAAAQAPPPAPAQNTKGVWHYTCAKGCEGGAGTQTACAKCGAQLVHNQAYHEQ